jgi:hypothetical protein
LPEEIYAPDAIHKGVYFDSTAVVDGRPAIIDAALGNLSISPIASVIEMDAPDGELHSVQLVDVVSPSFPENVRSVASGHGTARSSVMTACFR